MKCHTNWTGPGNVCLSLISGAAACGILTGCQSPDAEHAKFLSQKIDALELEKRQLQDQLAERDARIESLQDQTRNLLDLGPGRLDHLFTVDRIEIVRLTGGADYDGKPGDDGVTVYLRPRDAQGDPIKAAGEIRIQLLDVSTPGRPRELGLYVINDPGQLRKSWHSGFLTNHYTIRCGWQPGIGPPAHREVTVRATFLDWLTAQTFTAQKVVQISLITPEEGLTNRGGSAGRTPGS